MDQVFLEFFNITLASPILDLLMPIITVYGFCLSPLAGMMLYLSQFYPNQFSVEARKLGYAILVGLAVGLTLTLTFYYLALRPRPDAVRLIMLQPNFPSFPSGHATSAFSTTTTLILFVWSGKAESLGWKITACCSALLTILIALSRIYLGHHYPTDVVAGTVLGTAIGATIYGLLLAEETGIRRFRWLLWLQIAVAILVTMMAYLNLLPFHLLRWPYADKVLHFLLFGAITFVADHHCFFRGVATRNV